MASSTAGGFTVAPRQLLNDVDRLRDQGNRPPLPLRSYDDPDAQAMAGSARLATGQTGRNRLFCTVIVIMVKVPVLLFGALVFAGFKTRTANIGDQDSDRRKDGETLLIEQPPPRNQETEIFCPLARTLKTCSIKNELKLSSFFI